MSNLSVKNMYGPTPYENSRRLTEEDLQELLKAHENSSSEFYDNKILPIIKQQQEHYELIKKREELAKRSEELNEKGEFLDKKIVLLDKKFENLAKENEEADKKIVEARVRKEAARVMKEEARERKEAARVMKEEARERKEEARERKEAARATKEAALKEVEAADKKLQEIARKRQNTLTKYFLGIFDETSEDLDTYFKTKLADKSVTVEKSNNKSFLKINFMSPVISHLKQNPNIKKCNFLEFKEINDIPNLAEFLKSSNIEEITISNAIPELAKKSLAEAVAARKGKLTVIYVNVI
jgi:hypothetical protein